MNKPEYALLPELWLKIARGLSSEDIKNLRLVGRFFYTTVATEELYNLYDCNIFRGSATEGCLSTLLKLHSYYQNQPHRQHRLIVTENQPAFINATQNGHLSIVKQLYEWSSEKERVAMIRSSFGVASRNGHLNVLQQFYSWSSEEERVALIAADGYYPFLVAYGEDVEKQLKDWSSKEAIAAMHEASEEESRYSLGCEEWL